VSTVKLVLTLVAAGVLVAGASCGYSKYKRLEAEYKRLQTELELAEARLAVAEEVNRSNVELIRDLQEQRKRDFDAIQSLLEATQQIREAVNATNSAIRQLGATNEEVRAYLDLPIPDDLRRLLNDTSSTGTTDPN